MRYRKMQQTVNAMNTNFVQYEIQEDTADSKCYEYYCVQYEIQEDAADSKCYEYYCVQYEIQEDAADSKCYENYPGRDARPRLYHYSQVQLDP